MFYIYSNHQLRLAGEKTESKELYLIRLQTGTELKSDLEYKLTLSYIFHV